MAVGASSTVVNKAGGVAAYEKAVKSGNTALEQQAHAASAAQAGTLNGGYSVSNMSSSMAAEVSKAAASAPSGKILNPAWVAWWGDKNSTFANQPAQYISKAATSAQTQKVSAAVVANVGAKAVTTVKTVTPAKTATKTVTPTKTTSKTTVAKPVTTTKPATVAKPAATVAKPVTGITSVSTYKPTTVAAKTTIQQQIAKNAATPITNKATVIPASKPITQTAAKVVTGTSALAKYNRVTQAAQSSGSGGSSNLVSLAQARDSSRISSSAQDHYGQVQLSDGTWIDQVQSRGANTNVGQAKVIATKPSAESLVKVGNVYQSLISAGKKKAGQATPSLVDTSTKLPTFAQVSRTGVTTQAFKNVVASEQKAGFVSNEKAKSALSGGIILSKSGQAINQIGGRGINELGQLVTISTPVKTTVESQKAVAEAYKSLKAAGKTSGGAAAPDLVASNSYSRGAAQTAQITEKYNAKFAQPSVKKEVTDNSLVSKIKTAIKPVSDNFVSVAAKTESQVAGMLGVAAASTLNKAGGFIAEHSKANTQGAITGRKIQAFTKGDMSQNAASIGGGYIAMGERGLNRLDTELSKTTKRLPSAEALSPTVNRFFDTSSPIGIGMKAIEKSNNPTLKTTKNITSGIKQGTGEFLSEEYETFRNKPATYGLTALALYAGGEVAGAATGAAKIGLSTGVVKTTEKLGEAGVPFVRSAGRSVGRSIPIATDVGFGTMLGVQMGSQIVSGTQSGGVAGGTKEALKAGKELAIGGAGFKKGSNLVTDSNVFSGAKELYSQINPIRTSDLTPKVTKAKISELVGGGSNTEAIDLVYGKSFNIGNKPIVTHITGEGLSGFKKGAGAAPASIISGKTTQSFAKGENPFFKATVKARGGSTEAKYLNSAMNIAEKVFNTRKPLYTPEKFEITSAAIPEAQRAPIVKAIKTYQGELKVAGSVPMKAQANPFVTRTPHDLELYGDSVDNVIAHVSKSLKAGGFKEGKDFRRGVDEKGKPTNQVEFNLGNTKNGENWDAGIEVFDHKTLQSDMPKAIAKDKSPIAFGYTDKPSVLVGNKAEGFIKTQDLSEQVVRKVAGSTFFKDNIMQPAHKNRVKDILDTTTTATAFAVKGKLDIGKDIISFVNSASKKFTPSDKDIALVESIKRKEYKPETAAEKKEADLAKMKVNFKEKVAKDPVFKFIYENQRLPTIKEMPTLNEVAVSDKQLLYESKASAATEKTIKTGNPMIDAMVRKNATSLAEFGVTSDNFQGPVSHIFDKMGIDASTKVNVLRGKRLKYDLFMYGGGTAGYMSAGRYTKFGDVVGDHINVPEGAGLDVLSHELGHLVAKGGSKPISYAETLKDTMRPKMTDEEAENALRKHLYEKATRSLTTKVKDAMPSAKQEAVAEVFKKKFISEFKKEFGVKTVKQTAPRNLLTNYRVGKSDLAHGIGYTLADLGLAKVEIKPEFRLGERSSLVENLHRSSIIGEKPKAENILRSIKAGKEESIQVAEPKKSIQAIESKNIPIEKVKSPEYTTRKNISDTSKTRYDINTISERSQIERLVKDKTKSPTPRVTENTMLSSGEKLYPKLFTKPTQNGIKKHIIRKNPISDLLTNKSNTGWVSQQSSGDINPSSRRTFDRSGMGTGSSLKQTASSPSWNTPSSMKNVPQFSPSPKNNKVKLESPSPVPSKSSPSPIPPNSDSSPTPNPIPKDKSHGISPNPSPSPSPTPDFIPSFEEPTPIPIIPTSRKWRKTREIRNPNEIKKKRSDSQKGWHPGLLISSDKLVSRTKVAKFVESVKSVNAVKRKESVANMVKKAGTPMIKKSDEKVIVRLLM